KGNNWNLGHFIDALAINSDVQLDRIMVGGTELPSPLANSLYFVTRETPLAIKGDKDNPTSKVLELREGAKLEGVGGVDKVELFGSAKSESGTAIHDATELVVNSPFEKVHVGTTYIVPEDYADLHSFLSMY
ncbi:hypothetical protein CWC16_19890, partial [Pseudoalteromonas sp. S3776]|uniref:hypothetical protein n=1 Tax=Pseudoalteromonas sp. S3776 TaxID=579544 RepID=UPI0012705A40